MNKDISEGNWKEMRGQVKEWWGKLTDDDLEQAAGNGEQIVSMCSGWLPAPSPPGIGA